MDREDRQFIAGELVKVAKDLMRKAISNTRLADEMLDWINDGGDWRDALKHRVAFSRAIKIFEREYDMHPDDV